jgi:hypothetical protein
MEPKIAGGVGNAGADERVVQLQGVFQQVLAAIDHPGLAPSGELGSNSRGCIERRNAGARCAHPFGQRALGDEFGIDFARFVIFGERQHIGWTGGSGERADDLRYLAVLDQHADIGHPGLLCAAGCVGDKG